MDTSKNWVGSVWSHRGGRLVIGRLREIRGNTATLSVVGLGPALPAGASVLPPGPGGDSLIQVPVSVLLAAWKRMGEGSAVPAGA